MGLRCSCFIFLLWSLYSHALQIPRKTNQRPFVLEVIQATQQKLAEAHHRLDDTELGFDSLLDVYKRQALYLSRIGLDGVERLMMIQSSRVRQDSPQLGQMLVEQQFLRVVNHQPVFQIEAPGARVEIVAGQQGVVIIDQQTLEMKGVVFVAPQMHLSLIHI